ncbi:phosphoribosyltransferase [Sulfurovum sp.]|uniref:phosphoribosyltransferase n=1 Tax=Sulfurovum sp. TaxID=1969726 RepID=UPI0025EE10D1|nr:phosphoribosyltransferase [Sulfurovum sp.]
MFKDRKDAGEKLGIALQSYTDKHALVLAIPRGGAELGYEVAKAIHADFSLIICRKLPYPDNPESGFGAIAEDGSLYINQWAASSLPDKVIHQIIDQQIEEIKRRIMILRGGKPLPSLNNKTVILVDDGIAMGSTMHAAISLCKKQHAGRIIVAVPVAAMRAIEEFSQIVDEIVVLESPANFHAVAQVYENWYDVSDEEVLEICKRDL